MVTEAERIEKCNERHERERTMYFGAIGERMKARVAWLIIGAFLAACGSIGGVLYARTEKALDAVRNGDVRLARIEEQVRANGKASGDGIKELKAMIREMRAAK